MTKKTRRRQSKPLPRRSGASARSSESSSKPHPGSTRSSGLADAIVDTLTNIGAPTELEDLFGRLSADEPRHQRAILKRLEALERAGQVVRNRKGRYGLTRKMDLVTGVVQGHRDGYGFLIPEEGGSDLFLSQRRMRELMHGDRVVARVVGVDARGRKEGSVVEVLARGAEKVVGRYWQEGGTAFVRPDHVRMHHDLLIPREARGEAQHGEVVVAEITEPPGKHRPPVGRIVEVLGDQLAPGMMIEVAIRSYDIPHEFSDEAVAEAEAFGETVAEALKQDRKDLRKLPLVTIDGLDAKDFDDAVHCAPTRSGWKLTVAIADVSAYVAPGSALDVDARRRGTSVYFPERVVPMLPEALSNGLCSLRPHEDRLCLASEMLIGADGEIKRSSFFPAVMRSHARLTYDEVAKVLVNRDEDARARQGPLLEHLDHLYEVYHVLRQARDERGALDLDSTESRLVFDAQGKVTRVEPVARNDAHCLIEECMIAANVATARFLARHRMTSLYRIHDGPNADKLGDLRAMLGELGLKLGGGADPKPKDYAALIDEVRGQPESPVVQVALLRSLTQALYAPGNTGHFGLALQRYMHFTSPIRRYPDLVVHRAIKQVLKGGKRDIYPYSAAELDELGKHCSMAERRAEDATRDVVYRLKCEFLADRFDEVFDGLVTGVTSFGLFVTLEQADVSGLVHVSALGSDYFHFDPVANRLDGERSGISYKLGDRLQVRIERVAPEERKIDLELANTPEEAPSGPEFRRGRTGRGANRSGRGARHGRPGGGAGRRR